VVTRLRRLPAHIVGLWHNDRRRLLHEALLVFLVLGFLIAAERVWADLFYLIILPLALHEGWRRRTSWRWSDPTVHVIIGCGLIVLFALSLAWDESAQATPTLLYRWCWDAFCTCVFVLALADALASSPAYRTWLTKAVIAAASINGLISIIEFLVFAESWGRDPTRLAGWGETRHPILGAVIIGVVVLMAAAQALKTADGRYSVAAGIGLVFIALTGSRGPGLAILVALALLLWGSRPKWLLLAIASAVVGIGFLALIDYALLVRIAGAVLLRGDSHRFIIWQMSWHDISLRPLLGYGPAYRIDRPGEDFPHNLFLSTWLYTGLVGLTLLVAYLAAVLRQALQAPADLDRMLNLAILVHVLISAMTDLGQVIRGPGPMWYIIWLSTLFCAANGNPGRDQPPLLRS